LINPETQKYKTEEIAGLKINKLERKELIDAGIGCSHTRKQVSLCH
jgi:hypothetical protein